jgi:hypothetical protein
VTFVEAGRAVLDGGRFTSTLSGAARFGFAMAEAVLRDLAR